MWDETIVFPPSEIGKVATAFAVGARHVLESARRVPDLTTALAPFSREVAILRGICRRAHHALERPSPKTWG